MNPTPERKVQRDDLCRSVSFVTRDADEPNDGFTLDGYGAVFNSPTRIDSWEGCFDEVLAPGAFKKSLRERTPRMQFDHGMHPLIGSIPIGRFETVEEDAKGLHVVGRLTDNWLIQPVRDAIREGGIDGMSFRFSVVKEEWRDKDGKLIKDDEELWDLMLEGMRSGEANLTRTLKEVRMTEVGPVVWPAYEDTSVGVRSKPFTVDPNNRESLARAAFMIDAAVRDTENTRIKNEAEKDEDISSRSVGAEDLKVGNVVDGTLEADRNMSETIERATGVKHNADGHVIEDNTIEPPATEERAESDSQEPTPTQSDAADGHSLRPVQPYSRRQLFIDEQRRMREVILSIKPLNEITEGSE